MQNQEQKQVIQEKKQEDKKLCPFLTMSVMVAKSSLINGKVVNVPEQQLKISLCIKNNCAMFNETTNKCGLIK